MFEENGTGPGPAQMTSVDPGTAALILREKQPKSGRKPRIAGDAGTIMGTRPVRIGRVPDAATLAQQSLTLVQSSRSGAAVADRIETASPIVPVAESDAIAEAPVGIEIRRLTELDIVKSFADLNAKFDSMKESFDILEAHVSVGLAKSIAGMMKSEVAVLEQQIVARYRYRTRYRLALTAAFVLIGTLTADHFYPFFDRLAGMLGY
jgi:hypothetical protein